MKKLYLLPLLCLLVLFSLGVVSAVYPVVNTSSGSGGYGWGNDDGSAWGSGSGGSPSITFSCTSSTINVGGTITCICAAVDDNDPNPIITFTPNPPTNEVGSFNTNCSAIDNSGNSAAYFLSYTVTSSAVPSVPEFGFFIGGLTILSAVGVFFIIRRE